MRYLKEKGCTVFFYSQIGSNHVKNGIENQDSVLFERIDHDKWFMAIADGVSSAPKSKKGSQAAIDVVREICMKLKGKEWNLEDIKVDIVRMWKSRFTKDWNDYATTLNFLIFVDRELLVGQIGDGLMVIDTDGKYSLQGTTQGRYLTGGVPPVRFSM